MYTQLYNTHMFVVCALLEQRSSLSSSMSSTRMRMRGAGQRARGRAARAWQGSDMFIHTCLSSMLSLSSGASVLMSDSRLPSVFVLGITCSVCSAAASVFVLLYE